MKPHVLLLLSCFSFSGAKYKKCDERTVTAFFKKPLYEFSYRILDRVSQETDGHFVFSPISTWLQLSNIAEGAQTRTLQQISKVTGHRGKPCMYRMLRKILNHVNEELKTYYKSQSLVIVDKMLRVKNKFKRRLQLLETVKVASLNFDDPYRSADEANKIMSQGTGGEFKDVVDPYDFNLTSLLIFDAAHFSSAWRQPFNPSYTNLETFYDRTLPIGQVNMMSQTGYFNFTTVEKIKSQVLELPCIDEKHSMLLFLPTQGSIKDLYYNLKHIRLSTLFNLFKQTGDRLVNVKLPRFKITTELENLPELIYDLGVSDLFDPRRAHLKGISDYKINVSDMRQVADIEVTEEGVAAGVADPIIIDDASSFDFFCNRPFSFMLVDKQTEITLFAGMYLKPSVY